MSHLLAMSFDTTAHPSITLASAGRSEGPPAQGWGFAWYPGSDHAAAVIKDPMPTVESPMTGLLRDWDRFRGTLFLCHIRGAAQRPTQQDTHPFSRSYARRDWILAHNGDLDPQKAESLVVPDGALFEPVGHTDSERAFCHLLQRVRQAGAKRLAEIGWDRLRSWFAELDELGTANFVFCDGHDLAVYRDADGYSSLYATHRVPPHAEPVLSNQYLELDFNDPQDSNRTAILVATLPLKGAEWHAIPPGHLLVARRGAVIHASDAELKAALETPARNLHKTEALESAPRAQAGEARAGRWRADQVAPSSRLLEVSHVTTYRYAEPVERSSHHLRLRPLQSRHQALERFTLDITTDGQPIRGQVIEFEDVFGNTTHTVELQQPYSVLRIEARSTLRLYPKLHTLRSPHRRIAIPLVWMPWQRELMAPYLLPPELPEPQLRELSEFAMSFVERQNHDLVETLNDINRTLNRDFVYLPGSTTLETTPFEVYRARRGVCQDFANLFNCLARLLNLPARYRVGYIYTARDYHNTRQSEASHAWTEVYLPSLGWFGFDPTNACLAGLDHVRVAIGRNYRDATPTAGTIYRGGGRESLSVAVRVEAG